MRRRRKGAEGIVGAWRGGGKTEREGKGTRREEVEEEEVELTL